MFCTLNTVTCCYTRSDWCSQWVKCCSVHCCLLLATWIHVAININIAYLPHRVWLCLAISPCCSGGGGARSDLTETSALLYVHVLAIDRQTISHAQGQTCCITTVIEACCQPCVKYVLAWICTCHNIAILVNGVDFLPVSLLVMPNGLVAVWSLRRKTIKSVFCKINPNTDTVHKVYTNLQ